MPPYSTPQISVAPTVTTAVPTGGPLVRIAASPSIRSTLMSCRWKTRRLRARVRPGVAVRVVEHRAVRNDSAFVPDRRSGRRRCWSSMRSAASAVSVTRMTSVPATLLDHGGRLVASSLDRRTSARRDEQRATRSTTTASQRLAAPLHPSVSLHGRLRRSACSSSAARRLAESMRTLGLAHARQRGCTRTAGTGPAARRG